jgi:hypothetical protein
MYNEQWSLLGWSAVSIWTECPGFQRQCLSWFGVITDDMINHLRRLSCILLPWELQIICVQWSSWVYEIEAFALVTMEVTVCGSWGCLRDAYWHLEGRYWVFFLGWHILWLRTWRQYTLTRLHGITCQKIVVFVNIIFIGLGMKSTYAEKTCKLLCVCVCVCVRDRMREEWGGGEKTHVYYTVRILSAKFTVIK